MIANPPKRLTGCKFSVIFISGIPGHGYSQLFSLYITFFSYLCNKFRKNELLYNK